MRKFIFRLELLLQLRKKQEEDCQEVLAAAVRECTLARESLAKLHKERESLDLARREAQDEGISAATIRDFELYQGVLGDRIKGAEQVLREAVKNEGLARNKLAEAMRKRKILEKLREKQAQRHQDEVFKKEQEILEESAMSRFIRDQVNVGDLA